MPAARWIAPLCHQIWPSEETIPKISIPTLFLSGTKDEIVPCVFPLHVASSVANLCDRAAHMERLHAISTAETKILKVFPDGTHNDTVASPGYFDALAAFLEKLK